MTTFLDEPGLFPGWVRLYGDNPEVKDRLSRIRELRERRRKFNRALPVYTFNQEFWRSYQLYVQMRLAEAHVQDLPIERAYYAHKASLEEFTPVAHRTFWARWLYLERAFELASLTGDLLFGAIVLRTMAEDTWALLSLARFEEAVETQKDTVTQEDFERIRQHGNLLLSRFLPPVELLGIERDRIDTTSPRPFEGDGNEALEQTFRALNDYVHPNYGSHLLALFPERAKAISILLDAYITIYDHFLRIPWIDTVAGNQYVELPDLTIRSWQEEEDFLLKFILPEIQQHRAERGLAAPESDPVPNLKRRLESTSDRNVTPELAWQVTPDWFSPLRPLGEFVVGESRSDRELYDELVHQVDLGLPMRWFELSFLADARDLANQLQALLSEGRPSPKDKPIEWFHVIQKALELMLTTTQYKIALMSWSCIRQINDRNPVGAILSMRSVIEHYAVAVYLGDRLVNAWAEVEKKGASGQLPVDPLVHLEEQVARFLAGTKGTEEEAVQWKEEWAMAGLDAAINLRSATEKGLQNDVLGFLYNFGSNVIHGRRAKGVELCPPKDTKYRRANLSRAILALDLLSTMDYIVKVIHNAVPISQKTESLASALVQSDENHKEIIRTALTASKKLTRGKHYFGQGTLEDPITFAPGVEYYDAFYNLCEQLGLDSSKRILTQAPDGRFLDQVPDKDDKPVYFAAPIGG